MRRPRPAARYSEVGFAFVFGLFLAWGIISWWPQPALDVSPLYCPVRPPLPLLNPESSPPVTVFQPRSGDRVGGLPPSYERYTR